MQSKQDNMEKLVVKNETKNDVFERTQVELVTTADVTPSKKEVLEALAKQYKTPQETIRILKIEGKFGTHEFTIKANIYKSEEDLLKTENFSKKQRKKIRESLASSSESQTKEKMKKAKEEAAQEVEKPVEQPKEEGKVEEQTQETKPKEKKQ